LGVFLDFDLPSFISNGFKSRCLTVHRFTRRKRYFSSGTRRIGKSCETTGDLNRKVSFRVADRPGTN